MPTDFILIAILNACFCSIWVKELISANGLFWQLPKYYPYPETFFGKLLLCSICLSGWFTIISIIIYCCFWGGWLWIVPSCFISMAAAKIISK
jgi:hypothetical protein